jgi:nucleotide-binding universal stress UspA family protein
MLRLTPCPDLLNEARQLAHVATTFPHAQKGDRETDRLMIAERTLPFAEIRDQPHQIGYRAVQECGFAGHGMETTMFDRIVIGLDGSPLSERALATGSELARRLGAPVHLVRVADLAVFDWGATDAAAAYAELSPEMDAAKAEARAYLERVQDNLQQDGLTATSEVRSGLAQRELVEAVTPNDLLVIASHGRGGLQRVLLGSVAEDVARKSPAPVLIVREP